MIDRRTFVRTSAAAALAVLAPDRLMAAVASHTPPAPDLGTWAAVRDQFPLAKDQLHFGSFFLVSHPRPVREAIEAFRRALDAEPLLEVERRMFADSPDNLQLAMRRDMCGYLGARPEEIAITGNTTTGLALVYAGLPLRPGDELLATVHDHYSQHESMRFAAAKAGATTRRVALYASAPRATSAEMVANLRAAIRPETRTVGLTWVHSCTGVRVPIPAMAAVVAEANRGRGEADRITLIVDGAHGFGALDATVAELGCDFFCAGTHKWLFAPRGTGIIWGRGEAWARLRPTIPTFSSQDAWNAWMHGEAAPRPITGFDVSPGGFHAYEHQWGMTAAFRFHETIGRARVAGRIRELNTQCKRGLAGIRGVEVITPADPELSAGIICFDVAGLKPEAVAEKLLARRIVASASPYLPAYARLAPSLVNSPAEVDQAVAAVRAIAAA